VSGYKFTLSRHFNADGAYLLTTIHHQAQDSTADYRSNGAGGEYRYQNSFTCIPFSQPFVPVRTTPKPFVQGSQTAVVVGPPGEEIFTDKYGRVKVQFPWDRQGKYDAKSSCWIRVTQPWAGKRWGGSFWPRIGQEVIVDFLEGDPDRPIITGTVYNADQMPPYQGDGPDDSHPNDNRVSGIKSNTTPGGIGFNEWRFDDTKGREQVFIHAERDMDSRVKRDNRELILNDRHLIVGCEKEGQKVGDQREQVFQDKHLHVQRNQLEHIHGDVQQLIGEEELGGNQDVVIKKDMRRLIEGNEHQHVKKNRYELVDGNEALTVSGTRKDLIEGQEHLHVKGNRQELVNASRSVTVGGDNMEQVKNDAHYHVQGNRNEKVDGTQSLTIGSNQQEKVGQNHALDAGMEIHLKAGMKVIIEAGMQLSLKGPGGFVDIGPAGVTIQGTMVMINSGGSAGSGSGSSPTAPKDPTAAEDPEKPMDAKKAQPKLPDLADDSVTGLKSAPESWT
jgi:type VI secretion system secreted protein VgrG